MDVFDRLAPYIQDYIYRNQWTELREVQVAACDIIFNTDSNLLLSSGTASGKTEAAFLPALTKLYENPSRSVGILYISPLKALINDQFERLDRLLAEADVPVCKWHGDASVSTKNKLLQNPQGILQITPESLESMLINRREACRKLFCDLRFIIIDEVHSFMNSPRGTQLLCQLERVQTVANCDPVRIGLSATLGSYECAERWLSCGGSRQCATPIVHSGTRRVRLLMQRFSLKNDETDHVEDSGAHEHMHYLYEQTLDKKAIIFANSRANVEQIIASMRQIAEKNHTKNMYHIHHGNISAALREETEREMKNASDPIVTGATVTLELGIDLGALDRVVQVGAPVSASSFTQRIGRCGRRGQPAELLFTFMDSAQGTDPIHELPWDFVKTIAIVQLFLEENWVEPLTPPTHPYALLYHQTMSYLAANGEVRAAELAQNVLGLSVFQRIPKSDYQLLLRYLLALRQIDRTERGGLMIGLNGEHITSSYEFFSVFESQLEFTVKERNSTIGTVNALYKAGDKFALAGCTWEVAEVHEKARVLFVKKANGPAKTIWLTNGSADLHTHLAEKMKEVLVSSTVYRYLSESCKTRLSEIRELARAAQIITEPVTALAPDLFAIFPWLGTRQLFTLCYALEQRGMKCTVKPGNSMPIYIEAYSTNGLKQIREALSGVYRSPLDKHTFVLPENVQMPCKYNEFVPAELLRKQFVEDYLTTDFTEQG